MGILDCFGPTSCFLNFHPLFFKSFQCFVGTILVYTPQKKCLGCHNVQGDQGKLPKTFKKQQGKQGKLWKPTWGTKANKNTHSRLKPNLKPTRTNKRAIFL